MVVFTFKILFFFIYDPYSIFYWLFHFHSHHICLRNIKYEEKIQNLFFQTVCIVGLLLPILVPLPLKVCKGLVIILVDSLNSLYKSSFSLEKELFPSPSSSFFFFSSSINLFYMLLANLNKRELGFMNIVKSIFKSMTLLFVII